MNQAMDEKDIQYAVVVGDKASMQTHYVTQVSEQRDLMI